MKNNSKLSLFFKHTSIALILVSCFTTICNATQHKVTLETFKEIDLSGDMDVNIVITNESQQYLTGDGTGFIRATVEKNCLQLRGDFGKKITLYTPSIKKIQALETQISIHGGKLVDCDFKLDYQSKLSLNGIEADTISLVCNTENTVSLNNLKVNNLSIETYCRHTSKPHKITGKKIKTDAFYLTCLTSLGEINIDGVTADKFILNNLGFRGKVVIKNAIFQDSSVATCTTGHYKISGTTNTLKKFGINNNNCLDLSGLLLSSFNNKIAGTLSKKYADIRIATES